MDIREAIYTTRSMRRLKPDPIPLDVQARILDAAIRAPSEPDARRFLLVDDPELRERIAALCLEVWEANVDPATIPPPFQRTFRSGDHLARHFAEVPPLRDQPQGRLPQGDNRKMHVPHLTHDPQSDLRPAVELHDVHSTLAPRMIDGCICHNHPDQSKASHN